MIYFGWFKKGQGNKVIAIHDPGKTHESIVITEILHKIHRLGLWMGDGSGTSLLAKVCAIAFMLTTITQLIELINSRNDYERLFECFSVLTFCAMGMLKFFSLKRYHKYWKNTLDILSKLEAQELSDYNSSSSIENEKENFLQHIQDYTKNFKFISSTLTKIYFTTCAVFMALPFIDYVITIILGNENKGYPHILPSWYPLDSISIFGYIVTVIFEVIASVFCVVIHIAFDLTAIGLMITVCGQFSLLRTYSEQIAGDGKLYTVTKERDAIAHVRIANSHTIHIMLIDAINELNKLTKNILGVYFTIATFTLCSVAVQMNKALGVLQMLKLLQYMGATIIQLFIFCWYGDNVKTMSGIGPATGPFAAAHWCLSPRIRRELTLLGMGMLCNRTLMAGPFYILDLPSFVTIIRAAYSYYALIKSNK